MSTPVGSSQWMYSTPSGFYPYLIDQSLRFNDNDSAYLSWTPASAGNQKTWTWSAWVKRANINTNQTLFCGGTGSTLSVEVRLGSDNKFHVLDTNNTYLFSTTQLFRDVGAWYHFVIECDTTQATVNDRTKLYVNGEQVTSFSTDNRSNFSQNEDTAINSVNAHYIARWINGGSYFDGYMAEVNFIDGTALDATSFGETINGIWVPKQYSGSYGTNGFYLSFADSAAIGDDLSGNTNDFTATNLAASDVVPDSPTNNFATLNILRTSGGPALAEGNLEAQDASTACGDSTFQIPKTGKWYFESMTAVGSGLRQGVGDYSVTFNVNNFLPVGGGTGCYQWQDNTTGVSINGTTGVATGGGTSAFSANPGVGTPVGVTVDVENLQIYFQADVGSGLEVLGPFSINSAHTDLSPAFNMNGDTVSFNFGADSSFAGRKASGSAEAQDANGVGDFYYAPTTGALALCSSNLPEVTIGPNSTTTSDQHFNTVLWTGDGTTGRSITGVGFSPDFVWTKGRSGTRQHLLFDTIRGNGAYLLSTSTNAEATDTNTLTTFDSDGFTIGSNININTNTETYVGWNWLAGGTAVSNTDGTITSSVSANPDAGFSIVSWTAQSGSYTVGHGLNSAPELIITKNRDTAGGPWYTFTTVIDGTLDYLSLDTTAAKSDDPFSTALPTASVFSGTSNYFYSSGGMIAYCFHSSDVCKVGKYVGNNSTDGPFNYTGFRPAFVIIKRTDSTAGWVLYDDKRDTYNQMQYILWPNLTNAEYTSNLIHVDFLSNGFKVRNATYGETNALGGSYIYLAFAKAPFKYANAR